ncbi:hypothetical protein M23134_02131 [Microscilla marina ATCC 23134]|uniref:Uncharacterized protein n=1 Tax=Microscilla marina ATCC 23134 TaxID=313606 RepID=A1ZNB0_MICM2|nr:hypothetical protein M23134_02131 [Microscilla marina ATCC 23134]
MFTFCILNICSKRSGVYFKLTPQTLYFPSFYSPLSHT